jgi:hypothetical protein
MRLEEIDIGETEESKKKQYWLILEGRLFYMMQINVNIGCMPY